MKCPYQAKKESNLHFHNYIHHIKKKFERYSLFGKLNEAQLPQLLRMAGFFASTPSFLSKITKHIEDGASAAKSFSPSDATKALQEKAINTHKEFLKEHDRYMKESGKDVSDNLPWEELADPNEEAIVKRKILALSKDERTFIEPPPTDANFHFEYDDNSSVAIKLMEADPQVGKARFALVPRKVKKFSFGELFL